MSPGRAPSGVRRLNQRGQCADFWKSTLEKLPSVSRASQWPPSLETVVTFPCGSILSTPRPILEKKTFPCWSTTMPELGWPEAVNAAKLDTAVTSKTIEKRVSIVAIRRDAKSERIRIL